MRRVHSIFFLILLLFSSVGCKKQQEPPQQITATTFLNTSVAPQQRLRLAFDTLPENNTYTVHQETQVVMGEITVTEISRQTVCCRKTESTQPEIFLWQNLSINNHTIQGTACYREGTGYYTVENSAFCCRLTLDAFRKNLTPAQLLNMELYKNIQSSIKDGILEITLTNPKQTELWSRYADGQLLRAYGTAAIDTDGRLLDCSYTLHCLHDGKEIRQRTTITISPISPQAADITPDNPVELSSPEVPWLLERAAGYLLGVEQISADLTQTVSDGAYENTIIQERALSLSGSGDRFTGYLASGFTLRQTARPAHPEETGYTLLYQNGILQSESHRTGSLNTQSISYQEADALFREFLLDTLILPEDILGVTQEQNRDTLQLVFLLGKEIEQKLCAAAYNALYADEDLPERPERLYKTVKAQAYLTLECSTGLPIASGIEYTGILDMEGHVYELSLNAYQTYEYPKE